MSEPSDIQRLRQALRAADRHSSRMNADAPSAPRAESRHADSNMMPTAEPIAPERIWRALSGDLSPDDLDALVRCLSQDPELREDWRLAMEVHQVAEIQTREAGTGSPEPSKDSLRQPMLEPPWTVAGWLPLAATVFGLALLGLVAIRLLPPETPVERSATDTEVLQPRDSEIGPCTLLSCHLAWHPVPGVRRYELVVTTEALDPVLSRSDVGKTDTEIPTESLAGLSAPVTLLWQVTAFLDDGTAVRSATHRFEILE